MKKSIIKIGFVLFVGLFSFSCKYDFSLIPREYDIESRSPDFTDLSLPEIDKAPKGCGYKFSVLLIADTHFGRNGYFLPPRDEKPFYAKIAQLFDSASDEYKDFPPAFTVHMGDNSDTGNLKDFEQFNKFEQDIYDTLKTINPNYNKGIYSVVGNHDLYNNGWAAWKCMTYAGTSTYYFTINGSGSALSWYFLDSGSGILGANQLEKFKALAESDQNQKVIISHYPINAESVTYYALSNPLEIAKLSQTFAQNKTKLTFEGHYHPGGSSTHCDTDGNVLYQEEVIRGFVDKKAFAVMTVDLTGSEPEIHFKSYEY